MTKWLLLCLGTVLVVGCSDSSKSDKTDPKPRVKIDNQPKPVTLLPDEPVKVELKYSSEGQVLKYWISSDGTSGGDRIWSFPAKEVVIEINFTRGGVSLSSTRWPYLKLKGDLEGKIALEFAPKFAKAGAFSLGMNMTLVRIDAMPFQSLEHSPLGSSKLSIMNSSELLKNRLLTDDKLSLISLGSLNYDPITTPGLHRIVFDPNLPIGLKPPEPRVLNLNRDAPGILGTYFVDSDGKVRHRFSRISSTLLPDGSRPLEELQIELMEVK